jgi:hypothetical protein
VADEIANYGVAIRTFLRESSVLASAPYLGSNTKIYVGFPTDKNNQLTVPPFSNMVVILPSRGGPGDVGLGQQESRIDIRCYGSDEIQSKKIWRALDYYLYPLDTRRATAFTRNNCQINWIIRESAEWTLTDSDAANWPFTMAAYIVNYNGQVRE